MTMLERPKEQSRAGFTLWLGTILTAFVVLVYLISYIYLTVKQGVFIEINWAGVSLIAVTIQTTVTFPYALSKINQTTPSTNG